DTRADIFLDNLALNTAQPRSGDSFFYDFEFLFSIRNSGTYLHRRQQEPCENAIRLERGKIPPRLLLHSAFLNSRLRDPADTFSHFGAKIRVVEHRVKDGYLWDHEYPHQHSVNAGHKIRRLH